jgi:hypothetical protein
MYGKLYHPYNAHNWCFYVFDRAVSVFQVIMLSLIRRNDESAALRGEWFSLTFLNGLSQPLSFMFVRTLHLLIVVVRQPFVDTKRTQKELLCLGQQVASTCMLIIGAVYPKYMAQLCFAVFLSQVAMPLWLFVFKIRNAFFALFHLLERLYPVVEWLEETAHTFLRCLPCFDAPEPELVEEEAADDASESGDKVSSDDQAAIDRVQELLDDPWVVGCLRDAELWFRGHVWRPLHSNDIVGLAWERIGNAPPQKGVAFDCPALSEALSKRKRFTEEDLVGFEAYGLRTDNYVKSGNAYFRPIRPRTRSEISDLFSPHSHCVQTAYELVHRLSTGRHESVRAILHRRLALHRFGLWLNGQPYKFTWLARRLLATPGEEEHLKDLAERLVPRQHKDFVACHAALCMSRVRSIAQEGGGQASSQAVDQTSFPPKRWTSANSAELYAVLAAACADRNFRAYQPWASLSQQEVCPVEPRAHICPPHFV